MEEKRMIACMKYCNSLWCI